MPQLKAYHRPASIDEALRLLGRPNINTTLVAGGTHIVPGMPELVDEVVDLQGVAGLDGISYTNQRMTIGAMVRLQTIVEETRAPALLRESARREGPNTLRHAATIGGAVAAPDKESELLAALLVFEAEVQVQTSTGSKQIALANFLRDVPAALEEGLVTAMTLSIGGKTASERVARTPADKPIVAALARQGDDGQLRLALCGVASAPVLVEPDNVKAAINPPGDFRGSAEYRRQMAATLVKRVLGRISAQ